MSQSDISSIRAQELRFEYEQIRGEALQNDKHILHILGATVLLTSTIVTVTFSAAIPSYTLKGIVCFVAWLITLIGIVQIIDRVQTTIIIASYLRIILEPQLMNIRWETNHSKFRESKHIRNKRLGFSLATNQLITLYLILIGTLGLGAYYVWQDVSQTVSFPYLSILLLTLWLACTFGLLWLFLTQYDEHGIRNPEFSTRVNKAWMEIRDGR